MSAMKIPFPEDWTLLGIMNAGWLCLAECETPSPWSEDRLCTSFSGKGPARANTPSRQATTAIVGGEETMARLSSSEDRRFTAQAGKAQMAASRVAGLHARAIAAHRSGDLPGCVEYLDRADRDEEMFRTSYAGSPATRELSFQLLAIRSPRYVVLHFAQDDPVKTIGEFTSLKDAQKAMSMPDTDIQSLGASVVRVGQQPQWVQWGGPDGRMCLVMEDTPW